MGYTTEFQGTFSLNKTLTEAQVAYLTKFSETRRMKRNAKFAATLPDPFRNAVGLPIGNEAEYFVGGVGDFGQDDDLSVIDHNDPPKNQPGLWCQWVPSADGEGIEWNGGEKFYYYVEWLNYIIKNFLIPWGLVLNGTVKWRGEDFDDTGKIIVKDNMVSKVTY
jgi:hypothetical protein